MASKSSSKQSGTKQFKLTLKKSLIGRHTSHLETIRTLGLRKIHSSVIVNDIPSFRGMIDKVSYLLKIEEV